MLYLYADLPGGTGRGTLDAMADQRDFHEAVVDSLTEHIVVIDRHGTIRYANSAWSRFGEENGLVPNRDWTGADYLAVCDAAAEDGDDDGRRAALGIRSVISAEKPLFALEYPCHSRDERRWFMMRITPLRQPHLARFVISHQTITERKLAEERAEKLSLLDGLTGLSNRRHFDFFLTNEWRRAARGNKPLSLILFDVDSFKALNDHRGHLAGDECLRKIGECVRSFGKRPGDLAARYGGEEFAVVLADADAGPAAEIAERLRVAIRDLQIPHGHSDVDRWVTVSVGVATLNPQMEASEKDLIRLADTAMYESKQSGRNRVTVSVR